MRCFTKRDIKIRTPHHAIYPLITFRPILDIAPLEIMAGGYERNFVILNEKSVSWMIFLIIKIGFIRFH
ncbi:hypothetical protein XSR1_60082 [Xenorhabdus szentirmaii DSM 16338]|uniref:Uncharacterized protein n=1 Tax=Xenorhabdus szentirmaii DSM 16338 TaxID=1427518 RepID=W1J2R8_9GAMM|nr:hypothetical protein XSR1_60082 [Xenorhabdus szentirmaii DSM 16338]